MGIVGVIAVPSQLETDTTLPDNRTEAPDDVHARLLRFYEAHAPEKAHFAHIRKVLGQYSGREHAMWQQLREKYQVEAAELLHEPCLKGHKEQGGGASLAPKASSEAAAQQAKGAAAPCVADEERAALQLLCALREIDRIQQDHEATALEQAVTEATRAEEELRVQQAAADQKEREAAQAQAQRERDLQAREQARQKAAIQALVAQARDDCAHAAGAAQRTLQAALRSFS